MRRFKIFDTGLTEDGFKYEVWKTYYMTEEAHQNHISKKNIYNSLDEIVKIFDYRNLEIYEMEVINGRGIMNIKKITKEATIDKVLPNEIVKFDKILPKKIVNKIATTRKDN